MSVERPYDDQFAMAELALGYDLHTAVQGGKGEEVAVLTGAQEFTARSVIHGLAQACDAAVDIRKQMGHLDRSTLDEETFRHSWLPTQRTVDLIRQRHRPHLRYLRGVAGLQSYHARIVSGEFGTDEPHHDYQLGALQDSADYLADNDPFAQDSGGAYVELAGGGGKSRIVADVVAGFKSLEDPDDPHRVLVIAPDHEVQAELIGADGQSGMGKYAPHLEPGVINQDSKEWDKPVGVATRDMVRRRLEEDPTALDSYDLIVIDEAHTVLGTKTFGLLKEVRTQKIGLTGSAKFSEKKKVDKLLPKRMGSRGTRELVLGDRLAPQQYWICHTGQVTYQDAGRKDYTPAELRRISRLEERQKLIVDASRAFFRDGRNGVISCNTIEEAEIIAAACSGRIQMPDGSTRLVKVVPVHGKTKDNHQTFRNLDNDVIQGVAIVNIDTGWNVPRASFMINSRTRSNVRARQRAARLNRKTYDNDGNLVTSQYVDLMDTVIVRRQSKMMQRIARQITVPELVGEDTYHAGYVLASPATDGKRRDFSPQQFPPHLRWAVTMADGVPLRRLPSFGLGLMRGSPDGYLSLVEAARGLGTSVSRLRVAIAVSGAVLHNQRYLNETNMAKVEKHMLDRQEPII